MTKQKSWKKANIIIPSNACFKEFNMVCQNGTFCLT